MILCKHDIHKGMALFYFKSFFSMINKRWSYFDCCCLLILILTLCACLGSLNWFLDLFSHFRHYYLIVGIVLLLFTVTKKNTHLANRLILLASILVNAYYFIPNRAQSYESQKMAMTYKIVSMNLNKFNKEHELAEKYVYQENPDFLILTELTPQWSVVFAKMNKLFPYAKAIVREDNFGIGILSKFPFEDSQSVFEESFDVPFLALKLGGPLQMMIVAAHPFPPTSILGKQSRDAYLMKLSNFLKAQSSAIVMCGDLNITSSSNLYSQFLKASELYETESWFATSTWPVFMGVFGLKLDHCLVSDHVNVLNFNKGKSIGSDHFPIELVFELTRAN